ncbi:MAG: hypothetical protein ABIE22_04670 [archaeon]
MLKSKDYIARQEQKSGQPSSVGGNSTFPIVCLMSYGQAKKIVADYNPRDSRKVGFALSFIDKGSRPGSGKLLKQRLAYEVVVGHARNVLEDQIRDSREMKR